MFILHYYNEKESNIEEESTMNCDICCKDVETIGKNYCVFKRGNKQELWSCEECWEENKDKLTEELWSWTCYDEDGNIISFLPKTDSSISIDRKESSDNLIEN